MAHSHLIAAVVRDGSHTAASHPHALRTSRDPATRLSLYAPAMRLIPALLGLVLGGCATLGAQALPEVQAAYNEKLRAHKLIPESSAWSQKYTSGVWGCVFRLPLASVSMLGV